MDNNQNGKGDSPRNIFSRDFRENYDLINWKNKDKLRQKTEDREDQKELNENLEE